MRVKESKKIIPTVHNIYIMDNSGSMTGTKYQAAKEGIKLDFEQIKKENFSLFSLVEFDYFDPIWKTYLEKLNKESVLPISEDSKNSWTPLFRSISSVIDNTKNRSEKVLLKIFTDGQDNVGGKRICVENIKKFQELGHTITFLGTEIDVKFATTALGLDESNTLIHDNTSESIYKSFEIQRQATAMYAKRLAVGEDVSKGFYKKVNNE